MPIGKNGLGITGYYGRQYILERAYGNYLGLARLGSFMTYEMGLQLVRITCIAGVASLGSLPTGKKKSDLKSLEGAARGLLDHDKTDGKSNE